MLLQDHRLHLYAIAHHSEVLGAQVYQQASARAWGKRRYTTKSSRKVQKDEDFDIASFNDNRQLRSQTCVYNFGHQGMEPPVSSYSQHPILFRELAHPMRFQRLAIP